MYSVVLYLTFLHYILINNLLTLKIRLDMKKMVWIVYWISNEYPDLLDIKNDTGLNDIISNTNNKVLLFELIPDIRALNLGLSLYQQCVGVLKDAARGRFFMNHYPRVCGKVFDSHAKNLPSGRLSE